MGNTRTWNRACNSGAGTERDPGLRVPPPPRAPRRDFKQAQWGSSGPRAGGWGFGDMRGCGWKAEAEATRRRGAENLGTLPRVSEYGELWCFQYFERNAVVGGGRGRTAEEVWWGRRRGASVRRGQVGWGRGPWGAEGTWEKNVFARIWDCRTLCFSFSDKVFPGGLLKKQIRSTILYF